MPNPLACYHQATQSWTGAALLYQIAYWWPKAKVTRNGHKWIAKSAKEWCEETDLTAKEYERAAQKLRHLRLVATEQHWFAGKVVTHLRLTRAGLVLLEILQLIEAGQQHVAVGEAIFRVLGQHAVE